MICFAAHPDDETLGAGAHLPGWPGIRIVHATDGAPRDMQDAHRCGFATREAYANARRAEVLAALSLAAVPADQTVQFSFVDQECAMHLPELVGRIADLLAAARPSWILAPAYEGGHPDHDSLAFAVHTVCRLLSARGEPSPAITEYALYNGFPDGFHPGEFIPAPAAETARIQLSPSARDLKRSMIACFRTQQTMLAQFSTDVELFRQAPAYDFSAPPHAGTLYYENFHWGVNGNEWRELARAAVSCPGVSRL